MNDSFNVRDFGAVGDGTSDDHAVITEAIAAASQSTGSKIVFFPPGRYLISQPLVVNASNVQVMGSPGGQSRLLANFGGGPALLMSPPRRPLDSLVDSLVPGPGKAMALGPSGGFLFASDAPTMEFDGLTEFTAECFARSSGDIGRTNVLVSAMGIRTSTEKVLEAFTLYIDGINSVSCRITTADGTVHQIRSASVWTPGAVHHLAMVLHAGTLTAYYDGTAVGSLTVPGLQLSHHPHQEVTIGGGMGSFPYGGPNFRAGDMEALDSVRISNVARYTGDFTPPAAKFTADSDPAALLLVNFDNIDANFVVATAATRPAYLILRGSGAPEEITGVSVSDLTIECGGGTSGIYALSTPESQYRNIGMTGARHGFLLGDISFFTQIENLGITSTRIGLGIFTSCEVLTVKHLASLGAAYLVALASVSGGAFSNLFLSPGPNTIASLLCKATAVSIHHMEVDDEGAGAGDADIIAADFGSLSILGGEIGTTGNPRPPIIVDGSGNALAEPVGKLTLIGTIFFANAPVPELVRVVNPHPGLVTTVGIVNPKNRPLTNEPSAVTSV